MGSKPAWSYVWTFWLELNTDCALQPSDSGDMPRKALLGTTGSLTVDGYAGYNDVTDVDRAVPM